jgi:hypothetical protein
MSEGFGPREGKIADPVSLVESVYEIEDITLPKSNKPTFVQYESDANKNTVKNNSKKFELLPDLPGFACVYADIHGGNSWFDAFLMIMSPKYRNLSVQDRHNVAQGFRKECTRISDSILNQIPDEFFVAFKVDAKNFKSELGGSKEINMGFGFFIAWYFGLNLVYLEQIPDGHEIVAPSCYQSEECHAIFMKKYLDRFNAVVVLNLDMEIYNEEESTSVFKWADKRLCKLRKLSESVDKNTPIDTHWEFPISEDCNATNEPVAPPKKENARNIDPFSQANKNRAEAFFEEVEENEVTPETPLPHFKPGLLLLENGSVTNTDDSAGTALALLNPKGLKPLTLSSEAQEFIDRLKQLGNPEYPLSVADMAVITRLLELVKVKVPKKDQLLLEDSQQLLLEDIKKENLSSINPFSQANKNRAEAFFEEVVEGEVTPETPLPHFKPGLLLLENGSVTNTNDNVGTALALFNPKGLKPLKLSSEAQEFIDRLKQLGNPEYPLSVADMAVITRFLELLKANAPKKDQLLLEDSQQLFLKDIIREFVEPEEEAPVTRPSIFSGSNSPRPSFGPAQTRKNKKVKPNNVSTLRIKVPTNTNTNNKPIVARNNTSKLRIKAPSNETINAVEKSKRRTALSKTQPSKFKKPETDLVHRTEAIGLSGSTGAKPSSNVFKKGTQKKGVLNPKKGWRP